MPNQRPASAGAEPEARVSWCRTGGPSQLAPYRRASIRRTISGDYNCFVNSGHLMLRRGVWADRFLSATWATTDPPPQPWAWGEQSAIVYVLSGNVMANVFPGDCRRNCQRCCKRRPDQIDPKVRIHSVLTKLTILTMLTAVPTDPKMDLRLVLHMFICILCSHT